MNNNLTPSQQSNFIQLLIKLGLSFDEIPDVGPLIRKIKIDSVDHLSKFIKRKSSGQLWSGLEKIPDSWPESNNSKRHHDLTQPELESIYQALLAMVLGHSDRVQSFKTIVNSIYFPMSVSVIVEKTVNIKSGEVKKIPQEVSHDPVIINWGALNLEEGGQIQCLAPVILNVQQFNKVKEINNSN